MCLGVGNSDVEYVGGIISGIGFDGEGNVSLESFQVLINFVDGGCEVAYGDFEMAVVSASFIGVS